jgi:hypothetical protein
MPPKVSMTALAAQLGYTENQLFEIATHVNEYYESFHLSVKKPDGKTKVRHIDNPHKKYPLRGLQKAIHTKLLVPEVKLLPSPLIGGIKGRKLIEHLNSHTGKPTVICMDLQNCFPNISQQRVFKTWQYLGYNDELAKLLARITTIRGYLPQGPPTSPLLCNFVLSDMAREIEALCTANNLAYTQFIDDICISGDDHVTRAIVGEIHRIAHSYGQTINNDKTDIMDSKHRQHSMRIALNNKPKVQQKYIHDLLYELKTQAATGTMCSGEKMRLWNKICYLSIYSSTEAARLKELFNTAMQGVAVYDGKLSKNGSIRPCWRYKKDVWGRQKCPLLHKPGKPAITV